MAGTKLILNILLDANVTVARQAEKACRITCIIAEPAPSLSVVHTPLPIGTGNDSAKGDLSAATADATATSSVSSSSACAALAASNASSLEKQSERLTEETMVPVTYLFKTKHVQVLSSAHHNTTHVYMQLSCRISVLPTHFMCARVNNVSDLSVSGNGRLHIHS